MSEAYALSIWKGLWNVSAAQKMKFVNSDDDADQYWLDRFDQFDEWTEGITKYEYKVTDDRED